MNSRDNEQHDYFLDSVGSLFDHGNRSIGIVIFLEENMLIMEESRKPKNELKKLLAEEK